MLLTPVETRKLSESSCTYQQIPLQYHRQNRYRCWTVSHCFVPRSTFSDLSDLTRAELEAAAKGSVLLTLYGGHGAEACMFAGSIF